MIYETIVATLRANGQAHLAPLGVREQQGLLVLAPFHPSTTLENLRARPYAVINLTDDVRVFAGNLTGRRDWPVRPATKISGWVLEHALAHREVCVERCDDDPQRPRFLCREVYRATHAPFLGFNRAQAAVIEAAVLVSRLRMLPTERVARELDYLRVAVEKTAGPREQEAWDWLMARVAEHRAGLSVAITPPRCHDPGTR